MCCKLAGNLADFGRFVPRLALIDSSTVIVDEGDHRRDHVVGFQVNWDEAKVAADERTCCMATFDPGTGITPLEDVTPAEQGIIRRLGLGALAGLALGSIAAGREVMSPQAALAAPEDQDEDEDVVSTEKKKRAKRRRRRRKGGSGGSIPTGDAKVTLQDLARMGWDEDRLRGAFLWTFCRWTDGIAVNDTASGEAYKPLKTVEKRLWARKTKLKERGSVSTAPGYVRNIYDFQGKTGSKEKKLNFNREVTFATESSVEFETKVGVEVEAGFEFSILSTSVKVTKEMVQKEGKKVVQEEKRTVDYNTIAEPNTTFWWRIEEIHRVQTIDFEIPYLVTGYIVANFPDAWGSPDIVGNTYFRALKLEDIIGEVTPVSGTVTQELVIIRERLLCKDPNSTADDTEFSAYDERFC
jgi:hypothetical protein